MLLVILFFMGVRHSSGLVRIVLVAGFFWLALLIAFTMSDYRTRSWTPAPESWSTTAPPTHPIISTSVFTAHSCPVSSESSQEEC